MDAIATTPTLPTLDVVVPDWLQECLMAVSSTATEPVPDDTDLICRAFRFAYELHKGQYRASGEPYIAHPVAVAGLLRDLGGSSVMIAAGFLHDIVEDTDITVEEIESRFGIEVRRLLKELPNFLNLTSPVKLSVKLRTSAVCFWQWQRISESLW
jgi:GTP pyrophosphokinase